MSKDLQPGPYVVFMEDELVHTDEHPECDDPSCSCHGELSSVELVVMYEEITAAVELNPS